MQCNDDEGVPFWLGQACQLMWYFIAIVPCLKKHVHREAHNPHSCFFLAIKSTILVSRQACQQFMRSHTHTHTHTHTPKICAYTHIYTRAQMHTHKRTHTNAHTHAHTHIHTHINTHVYTHIHTYYTHILTQCCTKHQAARKRQSGAR